MQILLLTLVCLCTILELCGNILLDVGSADFQDDKLEKLMDPEPFILRVMTFNLWVSGKNVQNGLFKIAKHILYVYPDIVALQEVTSAETLISLVKFLGPEWSSSGRINDYTDMAVLTRHQLFTDTKLNLLPVDNTQNGTGEMKPSEENGGFRAQVRLRAPCNNESYLALNVWSVHLDYHNYGPYALCNKLVTKEEQIMAGEEFLMGSNPGRVQNVEAIMADPDFVSDLKTADQLPMLVMGDFNSPSHTDYVEATKADHCGWSYQWPVTVALLNLNLTDSYRELYPDPVAKPCHTWSTAQKFQSGWGYTIPEPQDRIDFVLYKSSLLRPISAEEYYGFEPVKPIPYHVENDWPSDHASVVVDFQVATKLC